MRVANKLLSFYYYLGSEKDMCVRKCLCNSCKRKETCADCIYNSEHKEADCSNEGIKYCDFYMDINFR